MRAAIDTQGCMILSPETETEAFELLQIRENSNTRKHECGEELFVEIKLEYLVGCTPWLTTQN